MQSPLVKRSDLPMKYPVGGRKSAPFGRATDQNATAPMASMEDRQTRVGEGREPAHKSKEAAGRFSIGYDFETWR